MDKVLYRKRRAQGLRGQGDTVLEYHVTSEPSLNRKAKHRRFRDHSKTNAHAPLRTMEERQATIDRVIRKETGEKQRIEIKKQEIA